MILDERADYFFASSRVRQALREAIRLVNSEEFAEAQIELGTCLSNALGTQVAIVSHDMAVLYAYLAIATDAGHELGKALDILSEGIRNINASDPNERFYSSRLIAVQLWLLEKAGRSEGALTIAKQAVERLPPPCDGDDRTNMYLEDLYFQYSSLLIKHGEDELASATLQGIADRCAHAMTHYGPMAFMEEGKFERFWLNQIGNDARGIIADKAQSSAAPQP
ncbi:hypothetical protein [Hyphomicrobium sp.]|uniref:hypothetical protein n=1 Tax=Hyphomicrobium sp. TaxID=82 RepID=UPI002FE2867A